MVAPAVFENAIERIINEFGQIFNLFEPNQPPREIEGVITTVAMPNAALVNAADIEQLVLYVRNTAPIPVKFSYFFAPNGKRYVIQDAHCLDVQGKTVCYKCILKA